MNRMIDYSVTINSGEKAFISATYTSKRVSISFNFNYNHNDF